MFTRQHAAVQGIECVVAPLHPALHRVLRPSGRKPCVAPSVLAETNRRNAVSQPVIVQTVIVQPAIVQALTVADGQEAGVTKRRLAPYK
jgi:hypothetical protein